mmetsp:Transcript_45076/g.130156  ORF Transcript_45076/g.130156 Transcript_45076/m.130156 type:complete len:237 (-) Transcript_45076:1391-2101(-)
MEQGGERPKGVAQVRMHNDCDHSQTHRFHDEDSLHAEEAEFREALGLPEVGHDPHKPTREQVNPRRYSRCGQREKLGLRLRLQPRLAAFVQASGGPVLCDLRVARQGALAVQRRRAELPLASLRCGAQSRTALPLGQAEQDEEDGEGECACQENHGAPQDPRDLCVVHVLPEDVGWHRRLLDPDRTAGELQVGGLRPCAADEPTEAILTIEDEVAVLDVAEHHERTHNCPVLQRLF